MDFFDEDDAPESPERARSGRTSRRDSARSGGDGDGVRSQRQQIMTRRLTAAAGGLVVLILLGLAFKGCLDARAERAFKDYVSDLNAIVVETNQLSDDFFGALSGDSKSGDISLENQVNGARGTAQALLDRVVNLDAPDEVSGAQAEIVLSYELLLEGLTVISEQLQVALGDAGSKKATRKIADQMQVFLASDVLFARAATKIDAELDAQGIVVDGGVTERQFLPQGKNDPDYLDPTVVAGLSGLGGAGGSSATDPNDGLRHGLALAASTIQPAGTTLEQGVTATVPADSGTEIEVQVQNQGEATETDIKVSISGDFTGTQTISTIEAGETQSVTIPLDPKPKSGNSGSITVDVATVGGEQVAENNTATYDLAFE